MKLTFRAALAEDVTHLVALLAGDELGQKKEDTSIPLNESCLSAFNQINADANNELIVVKENETIVGMPQLNLYPLSYPYRFLALLDQGSTNPQKA